MYGDERLARSGLEMRDRNVELARLNTKIASIKVSLKGLLMWGGLILVLSGPLSMLTSLWWLILIFGAILPPAIGLGSRISGFPQAFVKQSTSNHSEKELLDALERRGQLTPAQAAIETSLTASEADSMLCELTSKGYLQLRVDGGRIVYIL